VGVYPERPTNRRIESANVWEVLPISFLPERVVEIEDDHFRERFAVCEGREIWSRRGGAGGREGGERFADHGCEEGGEEGCCDYKVRMSLRSTATRYGLAALLRVLLQSTVLHKAEAEETRVTFVNRIKI
jgi:hypothetical protein